MVAAASCCSTVYKEIQQPGPKKANLIRGRWYAAQRRHDPTPLLRVRPLLQTVQVVVWKLANMHCCSARALSCLRADRGPRACWLQICRLHLARNASLCFKQWGPSTSISFRKPDPQASNKIVPSRQGRLDNTVHLIKTLYPSMLAWALPHYWICIDVT